MEAGQQFGSYTLVSRIGAGGMGEVWKAEDPRLRRSVAIKILPADSETNAETNARFVREARTAAQLYHPNIATIHSIEEHDGRPFIVMEYVEGEPLSRAIRSGRLGEAEVAFIGKGVAEALTEAHANGIVHRDIKPDNIVIAGQRVKVLDFGIAKQVGPSSDTGRLTDFRTQQGVILGTVQYMSPEQAMGKVLDGRSDIFSLGVVLYEAATGRLPFSGETVTDTLTRIIRDDAPDLRVSHPNLSAGLTGAIMKCLAKDRELRFRDAAEVAERLDEIFAASRTGRKSTGTADLPTAISVRHDERSVPVKGEVSASRKQSGSDRSHGPWPWIFATVLLVVLSVAGTAWFVTHSLRPNVPAATPSQSTPADEPANDAAVQAVDGAEVIDDIPPPPLLGEDGPPPPGGESVSGSGASTDLEKRPGFEGPGERPLPAEPPADASTSEQADAWLRRGFWLIGHGHDEEGVDAMKKAVALDPAMARAWLPIGVVALRRSQPEDAARAFSAVLRHADSLGRREVELAKFGAAIAEGDLTKMSTHCREAPFDREFAELRRLAGAAGADCAAPIHGGQRPGKGTGQPGGPPPRPRP